MSDINVEDQKIGETGKHLFYRKSSTTKFGGSSKKCHRCQKSVYATEEIISAGASYHKRACFTCKECNKILDSTTVAERKNENDPIKGEVYCKTCYGRLFGPQGCGFGGTLTR